MPKKKNDEPWVTIGRWCPLCGKHFVLCHPKDTRPFCEDCIEVLKQVIQERKGQNNEQNNGSDGKLR